MSEISSTHSSGSVTTCGFEFYPGLDAAARVPNGSTDLHGAGLVQSCPRIDDNVPMPLSGRDDDVRRLAHAVAADEVQAVLVTGEAGVGKTSLLARHLAETSHLVLRGQCVPLTAAIAYLPLLGALGTRDRETRDAVDAAVASLAPHLAESLSGVLPHLAAAEGMSPASEAQLFLAFGELLAELQPDVRSPWSSRMRTGPTAPRSTCSPT